MKENSPTPQGSPAQSRLKKNVSILSDDLNNQNGDMLEVQ